jgi:outer membrane biosynthesis protein TonB
MPRIPSMSRIVSAGAVLLVLSACTPGGQFDPTTLLQNDMFDSKKKVLGQREPVFPSGVPGTTTGVPPDLVKGYQPPPDQTDAAAADAAPPQAQPAEKPKPKPKPKVATQTPPKQPPTRISIGSKSNAPAQPAAASSQQPVQQTAAPAGQSQSVWPSTPPNAPAQQQQQSQSVWPNPPATASH